MSPELAAEATLAVRDIRAFGWRKRRMREELGAHLVAIHDDELRRATSAAAALEATLARWGDAREIGRELQRSVPTLESLACLRVVRLAPLDGLLWKKASGESCLRFAARFSAWLTATTAALGGVAIVVLAVAAICVDGRLRLPRRVEDLFEIALSAVVAVFVATFVVAALGDRLGLRALVAPTHGLPRPLKGAIVASYVVTASVCFLTLFVGALCAMPGPWAASFAELGRMGSPLPLWSVGLALLALFGAATWSVTVEQRAHREELDVFRERR